MDLLIGGAMIDEGASSQGSCVMTFIRPALLPVIAVSAALAATCAPTAAQQQKRPNIVMLMTDCV
jgi:hypothetical protein